MVLAHTYCAFPALQTAACLHATVQRPIFSLLLLEKLRFRFRSPYLAPRHTTLCSTLQLRKGIPTLGAVCVWRQASIEWP